MGNASGKANRTHAKRTHSHAKRTKNRTHKRKGGAKPSPLGKGVGVSSPHDERGSAPSNPTASGIASKRRKRTKKQPPLLPSVLIREALKLGTPPIKGSAPTPSKKINRNFKVTVTTSSSPKKKSI